MENKKILFITGIHGNEQKMETEFDLIKDKLELPEGTEVTFATGISLEKQMRNVSFNLNNLKDIEKLQKQHYKMKKLLEKIEEADIVLDLHNSPFCRDFCLVSLKQEELPIQRELGLFNTKVPVLWRYSETETISNFARNKGKLAYTIEFGGMVGWSEPQKLKTFLEKLINDLTSTDIDKEQFGLGRYIYSTTINNDVYNTFELKKRVFPTDMLFTAIKDSFQKQYKDIPIAKLQKEEMELVLRLKDIKVIDIVGTSGSCSKQTDVLFTI